MKCKPGTGETQPNRLKKTQVWRAHHCRGSLQVSKRTKVDSSYYPGLLTCIPQNLPGWTGKGGEAGTSSWESLWRRRSNRRVPVLTSLSLVTCVNHRTLWGVSVQTLQTNCWLKTTEGIWTNWQRRQAHRGYLRSWVTMMPSSSGLMRGEIIKERRVLPWWLRGKESTC